MKLICSIVSLFALVSVAADESGFRDFTSTKNQKIRATVVDVSADGKLVTIRREDGSLFRFSPDTLIEEDRKFIARWKRGEEDSTPRISTVDVKIKQKKRTEKSNFNSMRIEIDEISYEVEMRNLTREPLESLVCEYVIVYEDIVGVQKPMSGTFSRKAVSPGSGKKQGSVNLAKLDTVNSETVETEIFEIHRGESNGKSYEDVNEGVILRILDSAGTVLATQAEGSKFSETFGWDEAVALPDVE